MKTIFITLFQAIEAKNILRTAVVTELLRDPAVRIVCVTKSKERAAYYTKEVPHERITYEVFTKEPGGLFESVFSKAKIFLVRTKTTDLRRKMLLKERKNFVSYLVGSFASRILARKVIRSFVRYFDARLVADPGFGELFATYKPSVVLLAHLFSDTEAALLREARRRNIPTVGFINSWDKLTARYMIRLLPSVLLVYNEHVKEEAMRLADMPERRIEIVGVPQYDFFATTKPCTREEYLKRLDLPLDAKILLYAPMGELFSDSDWVMIDRMRMILQNDECFSKVYMLVRFPPNDFVDQKELKKRSWLLYNIPGIRYGARTKGDWDMTFDDLDNLRDTLAHSSLLVCYASSISIDAALMGKPVINIGFDVIPSPSALKSPTFFYGTEHYEKALRTGGIRLVKSEQDLIMWLKRYLGDPLLDNSGRRRLVDEQCPYWGTSGARIAEAVIQSVQRKQDIQGE